MAVNGFLVNNEVQKYNYESLVNYNTPDFSTSSIYQVGDYVMYQGKLYRCTTEITTSGGWDSSKWSLAILSDDVADLKSSVESGEYGLSEPVKQAILQIARKVAYVDAQGQTYYDDLYDALYPLQVVSITAVYTQGNRTVFSNESLDSLIPYLVVTAHYSDSSTQTVPAADYTLSGTLTGGTSTITVSYGGKTDTFDVTVTAFVIPEGYTRYGYIEKKTTTSNNVAKENFIVLNDQTDLNVLSFEAYLGRKSNILDAAGFFGVRNDNDAANSYACYCDTQNRTGIHFWTHGIDVLTDVDLSETPSKVELINPTTSPGYWRVNDGGLHPFDWTSSPVIPHGLYLFNNIPYSATTNFHVNGTAKIGDIILRKADGECVGYYVPCVYGGKIGMYDIISETFYTAATAAAVTISNSGCLYSVGNWA